MVVSSLVIRGVVIEMVGASFTPLMVKVKSCAVVVLIPSVASTLNVSVADPPAPKA